MVKTILTRLIAGFGMLTTVGVMFFSFASLEAADTWLNLFKALLFLALGVFGFAGFLSDFKNKKWPLEQ